MSKNQLFVGTERTELLALGQHYGIPTRFLDWTYDFNVALFFAVFNALKKAIENDGQYVNENIIIWIFAVHQLINYNLLSSSKMPLHFVVPSYYNNPNLNAQKGVLSYWEDKPIISNFKKNKEIFSVQANKDSFDQRLKDFKCDEKNNKYFDQILLKIHISSSECVKMAKYLFNTGYNSSKLFPGYDGIVKSIEEEQLIKQAEELLEK